jgi:teichuronic acid biosynthesis glycosyltransferase TuaG
MPLALVSVIMPAFNAGKFIGEAIQSVLSQTFPEWQLIIVNDGSTDNTEEVVRTFQDPRIQYYSQARAGVSAARNLALRHASGNFLCFLDSDDVFPPESLEKRMNIMLKEPHVDFVDGVVTYMSEDLAEVLDQYRPSYQGQVYDQLLRMNRSCLFGNTWLIRRKQGVTYRFEETMKYSEDLFFYLSISRHGGIYAFTDGEVLRYRKHRASAMASAEGLEKGYMVLYNKVRACLDPKPYQLRYLKHRIARIMFATYLKGERRPLSAVRSLFAIMSL